MKRILQLSGLTSGLVLFGIIFGSPLTNTHASASQPQVATTSPSAAAATPAVTLPVTVTNANTNPVFVESVDNPARQPFAVNLCASEGTFTCSQYPTSFTAASGVHTVIEQVSGQCFTTPGSTFTVSLSSTVNGVTSVQSYLPLAVSSPDTDFIPVTQTRIYPDAGTVIQLGFGASGGTSWNCYVSVIGYTQRP